MERARFDPDRLSRAFRVLEARIAADEMPAAALAVADRDGIVRREAFGAAADGAPVTTDHRFLIASLTKPMTAVAVMQLVEEGALSLETPVARLVPEFHPPPAAPGRPGGESVTIRQLLSHTSGVVDTPAPLGEPAPFRDDARESIFAAVCSEPLSSVPGSEYAYASDSYLVLGEAIRRLDGAQSFEAALRHRVLDPLGMSATSFAPDLPGHRRSALRLHGYAGPTDGWIRWLESAAHPGGGLWSTVDDVLAFGRAFLAGGALGGTRLIGRRSVATMTRDHTDGAQKRSDPPGHVHYGLGWALEGLDGRVPGSTRQFGHGGASTSVLWIEPEDGFVLVLLGSVWGLESDLRDTVIGSVYGALAD